MGTLEARRWYDFAVQHIGAESFLEDVDLRDKDSVAQRLELGNNDPNNDFIASLRRQGLALPGFLRLTSLQAEQFVTRYRVVHQLPNDGAGFSATLLFDTKCNQYTLAFRSMEYRSQKNGGDFERDTKGAGFEINGYGLALGQIASMERYWEELRDGKASDSLELRVFKEHLSAGGKINVVGYSLGGHLATVFTKIHDDRVLDAVVFNAPGLGPEPTTAEALRELVREFLGRLQTNGLVDFRGEENVYKEARYLDAVADTVAAYSLRGGAGSPGSLDETLKNIVHVYGHATHDDTEIVANSGRHPLAYAVFIEDQPDIERWVGPTPIFEFFTKNWDGDYGSSHSLTLLIDSLALIGLLTRFTDDETDAVPSLAQSNSILSAASNQRAHGLVGTSGLSEGDSLEKILDALRKILTPEEFKTELKYERAGSTKNQGFANMEHREAFHAALATVVKVVEAGSYRILPLIDSTYPTTNNGELLGPVEPRHPRDIRAAALSPDGVAYRYALRELNPFVILGADYTSVEGSGGLRLYDAETARDGMTAEYIEDRQQMLWRKLDIAVRNENNDVTNPVNAQETTLAWAFDPTIYTDTTSAYTVNQGQVPYPSFVLFGTPAIDISGGGSQADRIYTADGTDYLRGKGGDDYLEGGLGFDVYQYQASTFWRDDGNDTIRDADGKGILRYNFVEGGNSNTILLRDASVKVDELTWQSADGQATYRREGPDLVVSLNADAGFTVTIKDWRDGDLGIRLWEPRQARRYADLVNFEAGDEEANQFSGTAFPDQYYGHGGKDRINGGAGDDYLDGGAGDDDIDGGADNDRIWGGDGNDTIAGGLNDDELYGGEGEDWIWDSGGDNLVEGNAGSDVLFATGAGRDEFYAEARVGLAAAIIGSEGPASGLRGDWIMAGADNDFVVGSAGDDVLLGGGGDDVIVGGPGDDVIDGDLGYVPVNRDWIVSRLISEQEDGTTHHWLDYGTAVEWDMSPGGADILYGGGGSDWIMGGAGDDYIDGGSGHDFLWGGAGSDILIGGAGNDLLVGDNPGRLTPEEEGADYLDGGDGDDILHGNGGSDVLVGGRGNDTLIGGAGKDIYIFNRGDGVDRVSDVDIDATGVNASVLIVNVTRSEVRFTRGSLAVDLGPSDPSDPTSPRDVIHFDGFDHITPTNTVPIGEIHFEDGEVMTYADILAHGFDIDGTDENDDSHDQFHPQLVGTGVADRIRGFGGNDVLAGLAGNDMLDGGRGDDELQGGDGDDLLYGGPGNDRLYGGEGNDWLDGGEGWDYLEGGPGDDAYVYDTLDTIKDSEGLNRIVFQEGIAPEDLQITPLVVGGESRLLISRPGTSGPGLEISDATLNTQNFVYEFADGETLTQAQLLHTSYRAAMRLYGDAADDLFVGYAGDDEFYGYGGNDTLIGNAGNDTLHGGEGADALYGGSGDDRILGGGGDDLLVGGTGNDWLQGDEGADTYFFSRGFGQDRIMGDSADAIRFDDDILPSDISLTRQANGDLLLTLNGSEDRITVSGWYSGTDLVTSVERIVFGDGSELGAADIAAIRPLPITGTAGNDLVVGSQYRDVLEGLAGDDTLDGGGGDDELVGGAGTDTYLFGWGAGKDTVIEEPGEASIIRFAPGMARADISATRIGDDFFLHTLGTEHGLLLKDYYRQDHDWQIERADGETQALEAFLAEAPQTASNAVLDLWELRKIAFKSEFYAAYTALGGVVLPDGRIYTKDGDVSVSLFRQYYNGDPLTGAGSWPTVHTVDEYRALETTVITSNDASQSWMPSGTNVMTQTFATYTVAWEQPRVSLNETYYAGTYVGFDLITRPLYVTRTRRDLAGTVESIALDVWQGAGAVELGLAAIGSNGGFYALPEVVNGAVFTQHVSAEIVELYAGPSSNRILITSDHGFVDGGAGDDLIQVIAPFHAHSGGTLLYGNSGNDVLTGSNDHDLLIGGQGNDRLAGSYGNDTYYFFAEDVGVDVVNEATWYLWDTWDGDPLYNAGSGWGSTDTVEFGPGINLEGLALAWGSIQAPYYPRSNIRVYDTLDIFWGPESGVRVMMPDRWDQYVLEDMERSPGASWGVENFRFSDGTILSLQDMANRVPVSVLDGTSGDDFLFGNMGRDVLWGGAGNDYLQGDAGDDVYLINLGDGEDRIDDSHGMDRIIFGPGITSDMIRLGLGSLKLHIGLGSDVLHIERFDPDDAVGSGAIEAFEFSDGSMISHADLMQRGFDIHGTEDGETLSGTSVNDRIPGFGGDDVLIGGWGDDWLDGGGGNDLLMGGDGSDTYVFGLGSGLDTIEELGTNLAEIDVLVLGSGIAADALSVRRAGQDIVLTINGTSDRLRLKRWFEGAQYQLDEIRIGDSVWDAATLERHAAPNRAPVLVNALGDQHANEDEFFEFTVPAGSFYEPDAGDELTYSVSLADGSSLPVWLSFDALTLKLSGTPGNDDVGTLRVLVMATDDSNERAWDVFDLSITNANDAPILANPLPDLQATESIPWAYELPAAAFHDVDVGDTLLYSASLASGAALPSWLVLDQATGFFHGTPPEGAAGALPIRVYATDIGGLSAFDDFVLDIADLVVGTPETDVLRGGGLRDVIHGLEGSDLLSGGDGADSLVGGAGRANFLIGGRGNDFYDIDPGAHSIVAFNRGDGQDVVSRWDAGNQPLTLSLGGGIGLADLTLTKDGDAIVVGTGMGDAIRLDGWYSEETQKPVTLQLFVSQYMPPIGPPPIPGFGTPLAIVVTPEIVTYSINAAVSEFDRALSLNPATAQWPVTNAGLVQLTNSTDRAIGGALAYEYAITGNTDALSQAAIRAVLADPGFGTTPQPIAIPRSNEPPALDSPLDDQAAYEDSFFSLVVPLDTFADPEGDTLAYSAGTSSGEPLPAWLFFDADTRLLWGTPTNGDVGAVEILVTATDPEGLSASDSFTLSVLNTNDAPVLTQPIGDVAALEDEPFSLVLPGATFSDVDLGDVLTLSARLAEGGALPEWLAFDPASGTFSGTPANQDVGTLQIVVAATDVAGERAEDHFDLTVVNVNDAPYVAQGIPDQWAEAGMPFSFSIPSGTFVDVDAGDALTLAAMIATGEPLPAWMAFDPATGTFTGTPPASMNGMLSLAVRAADTSDARAVSEFGFIVGAVAGSSVTGGAGDDVIYGGTGAETLVGGKGNDALLGGIGDDVLRGGAGNDVLQGGAGDDVLRAGTGQNVLDGGAGDDVIADGAGDAFIVGGAGNDILRVGTGNDIIAFNRGDGHDTIFGGGDGGNTLSLGGGLRYSDLSLARNGSDLVLKAGDEDSIVLKDWYGGTQSVLNLQIVLDASDEFDATSSDPLYNRRVQTFDFRGMVQAFDEARAGSPGLTSWHLTNALLEFHLWGSDHAALGGDLAYWYGLNGALAGMSLQAAQEVIGSAGFGSEAQNLRPFSGLQEGLVRLGY